MLNDGGNKLRDYLTADEISAFEEFGFFTAERFQQLVKPYFFAAIILVTLCWIWVFLTQETLWSVVGAMHKVGSDTVNAKIFYRLTLTSLGIAAFLAVWRYGRGLTRLALIVFILIAVHFGNDLFHRIQHASSLLDPSLAVLTLLRLALLGCFGRILYLGLWGVTRQG